MTGADGREDLVTLQLPRQDVRELERALKTGIIRLAQRDGGRPSPVTARILQQLHTAATRPGFPDETPSAQPATVDHGFASRAVPMVEVAAVLGCSVQYARHLARTGRLRAHRVGEHGPWLTTPADLDAYRYGRQEATHGVTGPTPRQRAADSG